jgi:ABC-2 type transport system ATP-binding protein
MIETDLLSKYYGAIHVVRDLDLQVQPGEVVGFLGPNGAGKSTTVKMLTGLVPPDGGRARIAGFDIVDQPIEAKRMLGYVPESAKIFESLTADTWLDVIGALHHLDPVTSVSRRRELLDLFGLTDARDQYLREFSKGMKQKVVIAAALLHRPKVLILDEPFDGLDSTTALVMKGLLREMAAQGAAILFSSHILEVVERVCTRICVIDKGRKVADGTADDLCRQTGAPSLEAAFGHLIGARDPDAVTQDILSVLGRS